MENRNPHRSRREWSPSSLTIGIVIIAVGVFFLLYNFNVRLPFMLMDNWWALFILIAAIGPLGQAIRDWRRQRGFNANVLHSLTTAAIIVTISLFFFFNVSWGRWWPIFIIFGGLWAIARRSERKPDTDRIPE